MGARSRSSSLAARVGLLVVVTSPVFLLTACTAPLRSSFCTDYQRSWDDFTNVRDSGTVTPQELHEAGQDLRDRWDELRTTSDAPEDVTGMLGRSIETFTYAWIASSSAERGPYERSLQNERDYVALRCSDVDADIDFSGDVAPIETPRLN